MVRGGGGVMMMSWWRWWLVDGGDRKIGIEQVAVMVSDD